MEREEDAMRLRSIAEELAMIASSLVPAGDVGTGDTALSPVTDPNHLGDYTQLSQLEMGQIVDLARALYRSRRMRPRIFNDDTLFGEPAWDILLDLFIAEADKKPLSVTSACIGASVPTSTALRWLVILEERGFLRRENDKADARRVFLHLTTDGHARMMTYFTQLLREGLFMVGLARPAQQG